MPKGTEIMAQTAAATAPVNGLKRMWADPEKRAAQIERTRANTTKQWQDKAKRLRMTEASRQGILARQIAMGMPDRQKDLISRYVEGQPQTNAQVARELGITPQAVQQRLSQLGPQAPVSARASLLPTEASRLLMLGPEAFLARPEAAAVMRRLYLALQESVRK